MKKNISIFALIVLLFLCNIKAYGGCDDGSNGTATITTTTPATCAGTGTTITVNVSGITNASGDDCSNGSCSYTITVPSGWTVSPQSGSGSGSVYNGDKRHTITPPATAAAGVYTYSISGNVSGTTSGSYTVKRAPTVSITAPSDICSGSIVSPATPTVTQNNGTQSASGWQWSSSSGGTYENFTPSSKTWTNTGTTNQTYYLHYYSENECGRTTSSNVSFAVKPNPTVGITGTPGGTQCAGTEITLNGTSNLTGTTYSWSGGSTAGSNVVTGADHTYTVTCTGTKDGCEGSATTSVSFYPALNRSSITEGEAWRCEGVASGAITISGSDASGAPGIYYQWLRNGAEVDAGNGMTSYTISSDEIASLSEGDYTYTRMVKDNCNDYGASEHVFTLHIIQGPSVTGISPSSQEVCQNDNTHQITVSTTGGHDLQYTWYNGNDVQVGTGNPWTVPTATAGNFEYYCVVSDNGGCEPSQSDNVSVRVWENPTINSVTADYNNTCTGTGIKLTANTTAGSGTDTNDWRYNWESATSGGGIAQNSGHNNFCTMTPTVGGTYTYNVTVTDNYGCTAAGSKSGVNAYSGVAISGAPAGTIAHGTTVTLTATPMLGTTNGTVGDCTYEWTSTLTNGAIETTNELSHAPELSTHYDVVATVIGIGCTLTGTQNITVNYSSGGADESCGGSAVIYCTPNGTGTNGSSTDPVKIERALELARAIVDAPSSGATADNPVIIRMASGIHEVSHPVNLASNLLIDGGWTADVSSGIWTKGTGETKIYRNTSYVDDQATAPRLVAVEGDGVSGFKMQDVTVETADAPIISTATVTDSRRAVPSVPYTLTVNMTDSGGDGWCYYDNNYGIDCGTGYWVIVIVEASTGSIIGINSLQSGNSAEFNVQVYDNKGVDFYWYMLGTSNYGTEAGITASVNGTQVYSSRQTNTSSLSEPIKRVTIGDWFSGETVSATSNSIILSWNETFPNIYNVYYRAVGNDSWTTVATNTTATSYTISDLASGNYEWKVETVCDLPSEISGTATIGTYFGDIPGISTYAMHLKDCRDYELTRCQLIAGNASAGSCGAVGAVGGIGVGGVGGVGGARGENNSNGSNGTAATNGGSGGSGGSSAENDNCNTARADNGGNGIMGNMGSVGNDGSPASILAISYGEYFTPLSGSSGTNGGNGTGGGGGGGGGGAKVSCNWVNTSTTGGAGGKGGNGGGGGYGGAGGYGGGSSFGLYLYGTSISTIEHTSIIAGSAGSGGSGGFGGAGGAGSNGAAGGVGGTASTGGLMTGYCYGGSGGSGGKGGSGGRGGKGGSGANGVSYKIAVVDGSGLNTSQSVASGTSTYSTDLSTNYISSIDYGSYSKKGCTNSQIAVTKTSGTFENYTIYDKTPSSASYSGNTAIMAFPSTGSYLVTTSTSQYNPYIFITQERTLGGILAPGESTPTNDPVNVCQGAATFTYSGSLDNGEVCLWYLVDEEGNEVNSYMEQYNGSALAGYTIPVSVDPGHYYVKLILKSNCCGLSVPIWKEVTILPAPTATISGGGEICPGASRELTVTFTGSNTFTYQITGDTENRTLASGTTATISVSPTEETTYYITSLTDGNGCEALDLSDNEIVTISRPDIEGVTMNDFVWLGNAGNDWNSANNWMQYNGSSYELASSEPTSGDNVLIKDGTCVSSNNPMLTSNGEAKNLTIGSGRSLDIDEYTLSVAGNFTNNGTFTAGTGTVVFNGSTTQTISGTSLTFNNVTFNNDKNFTLDGLTPTVTGLATFTAGIVNGDMNFGTSATTADASRTSHVEGKVTKAAGSSSFTFPTGNAGVLGSVTAKVTSDTWVRFHNLVASGVALPADYPRFWNPNDNCDDNETRFDHVSNFEYWDISSPAGLSNATIVASADNASKHFGSTDPAPTATDILGAIWTDGCWKNLGGSGQSITDENKTIRVEGVAIPAVTRAGTPYFTLGSKTHETLLPIELVSFTAQCDGRSALVEWTTATEKNNDYFSLERSDDAVNFIEIARVAGAGNSIEPIDYSYTDYGIHGGDNYYRLVQVDYDGTRTVSEIVVANCIEPEVGEPDVQAYPNPFSNDLTVVMDNFGNRAATIEVYDMLGKLIYTNKVAAPQNSYETILNLSNLPPAAYTVRVSTNDFVINRNVVKQ